MIPVDAEVWGIYGPAWKTDGHWFEACPACEEDIADFDCCLCNGRSILPVPGKHVRYGLRTLISGRTVVIDRFKDEVVEGFGKRHEAIKRMVELNYPEGK